MCLIPYYIGWLWLEGKCELDTMVTSMHTEFLLHDKGPYLGFYENINEHSFSFPFL